MVVGKKEPSDVKYKKRADLILEGTKYENQNVYSDWMKPGRRDVFPGNSVMEDFNKNNLPKKGKAKWMGKKYQAKLSFRYGKGGRKIPVYQFFL